MWECKVCGSTDVQGTGSYEAVITLKERWIGGERVLSEFDGVEDYGDCVERSYTCTHCGGEVKMVEWDNEPWLEPLAE